MEERKEKSRTAFRTCIYSERLLGGARQGEREIKEGQRKTNMEKKKKKAGNVQTPRKVLRWS